MFSFVAKINFSIYIPIQSSDQQLHLCAFRLKPVARNATKRSMIERWIWKNVQVRIEPIVARILNVGLERGVTRRDLKF